MRIVRSAKYLKEYRLLVGFDDGTKKVVDLEAELEGEIFEPLRDLELFKKLRVDTELDTIVWANGADFAPEFLFDVGVTIEENECGALQLS